MRNRALVTGPEGRTCLRTCCARRGPNTGLRLRPVDLDVDGDGDEVPAARVHSLVLPRVPPPSTKQRERPEPHVILVVHLALARLRQEQVVLQHTGVVDRYGQQEANHVRQVEHLGLGTGQVRQHIGTQEILRRRRGRRVVAPPGGDVSGQRGDGVGTVADRRAVLLRRAAGRRPGLAGYSSRCRVGTSAQRAVRDTSAHTSVRSIMP